MGMEKELAKVFLCKEKRRDPDVTTNIMPPEGFWKQIFSHWGINPSGVRRTENAARHTHSEEHCDPPHSYLDVF